MISAFRSRSVHVLLLSHGHGDLEPVAGALRQRGAAVSEVASLAEALSILDHKPAEVMVVHVAADAPVEEAVGALVSMQPSARLVAAGPKDDAARAAALMKLGAADYLTLPIEPDHVARVCDSLLVCLAVDAENGGECSDDEVLWNGNPPVILIGQSPAMVQVRRMVRQLADSRASALIFGETGTGKEIVARAIHRARRGIAGPFVAVNCAQMSGGIMESQLFGHVRGAFTGAVSDNLGFFRAAEGGTLFLDEVSEMSGELQAKLLRAIQEREVIPVGSARPVPVDVDILSATNRHPTPAVEEGLLRKDLYYRLAEVSLYLPPLRERAADVPRLVRWFIGQFAKRYGTRPKRIEHGVLEFLLQHDWPGNVRELENVVHRVFAFGSQRGSLLMASVTQHVAGAVSGGRAQAAARAAATAGPAPVPPAAGGADGPVVPLVELERREIEKALAATRGNVSKAAHLLGIERHRLSRRLRSYGLRKPCKTNQEALVGALGSTGA